MSLIICPECGKEISDKAQLCPDCGYPLGESNQIQMQSIQDGKENTKEITEINETKTEQNSSIQAGNAKQKEKVKKKIKPFHILIPIVGIAVVCVIVVLVMQNNKYNDAVSAYKNGKYVEAYDYFKNSNYRDSNKYLEKTVEEYTAQLIEEKDFETADKYLNMVKNEAEHSKLEQKMSYVSGLELFEKGLFEEAVEIFKNISEYEDAKEYELRSKFMNKIQGEWALHGVKLYGYNISDDCIFAAFVIDGWNIDFYYCEDGKSVFSKIDSSTLTLLDDETAVYKTNNIEFNISYLMVDVIGAEIVRGKLVEYIKDGYMWNYFGSEDTLAFDKEEIGIR